MSAMELAHQDPLAQAAQKAVQGGDLETLRGLLGAHRELASAQIRKGGGSGTLLHSACDWPGFFPQGAAVVRLLLDHGADPNVRTSGGGAGETPLHYAASSDDAEVAQTLIAGGADIEAPDGSIGRPLSNAVGYGCWQVAWVLVAAGARVDTLWEAAALGMSARLAELCTGPAQPSQEALQQALWHACCGGQPRTAAYLLTQGADLGGPFPDYAGSGLPLEAVRHLETRRELLVRRLEEWGAS